VGLGDGVGDGPLVATPIASYARPPACKAVVIVADVCRVFDSLGAEDAAARATQISTLSILSVAMYSTRGPRFGPAGSIAMNPLLRRRVSLFLAVATSHSR
jgi:hypothetical protein